MRKLRFISVIAVAVVTFVVGPARATFAGSNGLLAYQTQVGDHVQLFTVHPDSSGARQLTHWTDSDSINASWSPDGRRIAFVRHWTPPHERFITYLMNADGTGLRALDRRLRGDLDFSWFPDGRHALMVRALKFVVVDLRSGVARDAGVPGLGSGCVLPDGKRVVLKVDRGGGQSAIFVGPLGGGRGSLERITPWQSMTDKIDCSPDGTRVAFSSPASQSAAAANVYTIGIDGRGLRQLTHNRGPRIDNGVDSWSPDGTKIAFASNRTGTYQIYAVKVDGTGITRITRAADAHLAAWGRRR
jgi:dipeptidyl aminopeptidase/acylaminoacyl peptidase